MKKAFHSLILLKIVCGMLFFMGCSSVEEGVRESPIGSVVSGKTSDFEGYLGKVKESNEQARREEEREYNRDTVRAYNLKTGKYQYVPTDSVQHWNEKERRWEFSP